MEAPTSQPKTDGTGKSEAFGDNLVETALEWKHHASLLFLLTPVPLPMVFRSFVYVVCFGLVWSLFFALSSLPSWFCLALFVKTRAIATLWGTDQKRECLILRFSHILRFAPYNGGFMPEV